MDNAERRLMAIDRIQHVISVDGLTYACAFEDERMSYAKLVWEVEEHLLEEQVLSAIQDYDTEQAQLCYYLETLLGLGRATGIGHYFTVAV